MVVVEGEDEECKERMREAVVLTPKLEAKIRAMRVLAIDEISMVSAELLDTLDCGFREARKSPLPFGGVQVLLVGDFCQLKPVHGRYAFQSRVWSRLGMRVVNLTQPMRQGEGDFVSMLAKARMGNLCATDVEWLRDNAGEEEETDSLLCFRNATAREHNERVLTESEGALHVAEALDSLWEARSVYYDPVLDRDISLPRGETPRQWAERHARAAFVKVACTQRGITVRDWVEKAASCQVRFALEERLPMSEHAMPHSAAAERFVFKDGARVKCTRNIYRSSESGDREMWLANGQMGTVVGRVDEEGEVILGEDEERMAVRVRWDAIGVKEECTADVKEMEYRCRQSRELARLVTGDASSLVVHVRVAMPLAVAYARTFHSAQGCTISEACRVRLFDLVRTDQLTQKREAFAGMAYVAMSRFARVGLMRLVTGGRKWPMLPDGCAADEAVRRFYEEMEEPPLPFWEGSGWM